MKIGIDIGGSHVGIGLVDEFGNIQQKKEKYIVEKIFDEDLIIGNGQIVIDKNTNISLTKEDIERNKEEYINELITEFDNFINMYIDNKTLVIVYNKSELRNMFFDNDFDSELIVRYLK